MSDLYLGDCREVRSVLADNSVDTIITDPPYGLTFMGKGWDKGVPGVEFWKEFLAVAKPGAMLLAFGGTRTFHRMTAAIEDAGWEIRDCMMWLYGSGFPKSLDISKAIDKAKGAEREVIGTIDAPGMAKTNVEQGEYARSVYTFNTYGGPVSDLAREWSGWGTALKPAWEPIIVAMKPLDGTFAENAGKWGVAGINVDGGRIGVGADKASGGNAGQDKVAGGLHGGGISRSTATDYTTGRWPANLILDEDAAAMLDEQSGELKTGGCPRLTHESSGMYGMGGNIPVGPSFKGDSGGASRFFYCSKASKSERNAGCEGLPEKENNSYGEFAGTAEHGPKLGVMKSNFHPTVKPLKLMEYLCTLTKTPTGGIVLDPFAGSGTTLLAAKNTGREYIGIEQNEDYFQIIKARLGV